MKFVVKQTQLTEYTVEYSRDDAIAMMLHFFADDFTDAEIQKTDTELQAMTDQQLCDEFWNAIIDYGGERTALQGATEAVTESIDVVLK